MENKVEWGCKCICFKVLHAVSVSILPDCLEQHAMSNCVLLVIPGPRASQIKGWWCTHHHISRCPVDQQQSGRGRWGRSPHMIPAVQSHTDGSHREEPLEGRFSNVSWHLSGHSGNTLSGADCWSPKHFAACTVLSSTWHASQSLMRAESVEVTWTLSSQERCPLNFLGMWEARGQRWAWLLFMGIFSYTGLFEQIIHQIFDLRVIFSLFCWRWVVIIKGWSGLRWIKISFFLPKQTRDAKYQSVVWTPITFCFCCLDEINRNADK